MFFAGYVKSQEKSGISLSNFGGINSVRLNPSSLVNSKIYYDINIVSGDIFTENNFLFIHQNDYNLKGFLNRTPQIPSAETSGEGLDYNANIEFINGFEQTDILGPSFSIVMGNHATGIFTRAVTMTSVKNLPGYLGILFFEGLKYDTLHGIEQNYKEFEVAVSGWWEIGLSYAYTFKKIRQHQWSLGINARRLFGYSGVHIANYDANYTIIDTETINIKNLNAEIRYSLPIDYDTNEFPDNGRTFKGRGTAFDLGFTYRKNKESANSKNYRNFCEEVFEDYIFKIGVSVLDLGSLRFTENARQHSYENVSAYWQKTDTLEFRNINDMARQISTVFYNDPDASLVNANKIVIGMPTALSLQGDYNYFANWHIAGMVVIPLKIGEAQIHRPSQVLASLRYETNTFEVALPVSLYDFNKPRIGFSARLYYFTVGTEKLGGFFGNNDFYGLDFYFSIKFHILKGWCSRYNPPHDCRNLAF